MKSPIVITALISLDLVSSVSAQTNSLDDNIIIAQSRTEYECVLDPWGTDRVNPPIPGTKFDGVCWVPISAGRCVGYSSNSLYKPNADPNGMEDCSKVSISEDRLNGKKYYQFYDRNRFILER